MHTLVIWATAVSLTPLVIGVAWEALILLRRAMARAASTVKAPPPLSPLAGPMPHGDLT